MVTLTVDHYELKWTKRAMQRCPTPITSTAILETEPDYTVLGTPTTDWSHRSATVKERQFMTRDHGARRDHIFVVRVEEA